ncbi:uncharacterized [Tachysurus ichikawai]
MLGLTSVCFFMRVTQPFSSSLQETKKPRGSSSLSLMQGTRMRREKEIITYHNILARLQMHLRLRVSGTSFSLVESAIIARSCIYLPAALLCTTGRGERATVAARKNQPHTIRSCTLPHLYSA